MIEPVAISVGVGLLVKSAPHWFPTIRDKVISSGKDELFKKGQERVGTFLDERKHQRHVELALQNAAERGIRQWQTLTERDHYNSVLQILAEGNSEALRREAMQLFTLSDEPDLTGLTEKYNLSQRITALAQQTIHAEIDAAPYLHSFFQALLAELYNDSLFREQMSDVIRVRAAIQGTRSLAEICQTLENIQGLLADAYTPQVFQRELQAYLEYIEKKYRFHKFAGIVMRGEENKAPELDHIFVPLRTALSSRATHAGEVEDLASLRIALLLRATHAGEAKAPTDLVALLEQHPYLMLLGGPGAGKSTTTNHLTWLHAKAAQQKQGTTSNSTSATLTGDPLPLRIELRLLSEARRQNVEYSFLSYAAQVLLGREHITVSTALFETLLERRALFVLFDGLDEVATLSERRQLVEQIETFTQRYPGNRVLVTSRPVGYELASITDQAFQHAEILSFDDAQIQQFLESWYHYVLQLSPLPSETRQELNLFLTTLKENPRLHRLAVNPLLLTVMTALHRYERLPDERVLIYDKCSDLLLDTWARLKHEGVRWKEMKLGKEDQKACLAHLGFILHQRSQELAQEEQEDNRQGSDTAVDVSASFLNKELRHFLASQNLLSGAEQHAEVERLLEMVRTEAGLIVSRGTGEDGEPLYGFVHRTFQEYFAALDVLNQYQQEDDSNIIREFLAVHVHDPHWQEVLLLLFGKFKHKFATNQLRFILERKTQRSRYSEVLQQDLFFVANCLADGIVVDQNFAGEVITKLGQVVQETPFTSQLREAIDILLTLQRTRHYAAQSKQVLLELQQCSSDLNWRLQIAKEIYRYSLAGSAEQRESGRLLKDLTRCRNLTLEQEILIAQTIHRYSLKGSDEEREGGQLLIARYQRGDLTIKQEVQLACAIYFRSPSGSDERREGLRLLKGLMLRGNLTLEQEVRIARAIYLNNPSGSDERREGVQLLIARYQRGDLTLEQEIQIAQAIYQTSLSGSNERHEGAQLLIARYQRGNLTLEQGVQIACAIYLHSPLESDEQREGLRLLKGLMLRDNLTLEQEILIARAIDLNGHLGSNRQPEGLRLLKGLMLRGNLTLEQEILIVQAIYQTSLPDSNEEREGGQLLIPRYQRAGLTLEQEIQITQAVYQYSPSGSDEKCKAFQFLEQIVQNTKVELETRLKLALLPCEERNINFRERIQMVQVILMLTDKDNASKLLETHWQSPSLANELRMPNNRKEKTQYDHFISDIPAIFELAQQDVVPLRARDELYQLLQEMVPLFVQIDPGTSLA